MTNELYLKRDDVLNLFEEYQPRLATHVSEFGDALEDLKFRTLESQQGWIPVSERLPEEEEIVLITIDSSCYPRPFVDMGFYKVKTKKWYWFNGENINHSIKVTGWMSLPQPYKAESE